jgi:hypothetical protein
VEVVAAGVMVEVKVVNLGVGSSHRCFVMQVEVEAADLPM